MLIFSRSIMAVSRYRKMTICLLEITINLKSYTAWFWYRRTIIIRTKFFIHVYEIFLMHWLNLWMDPYTVTRMISAKRIWFQGTKRNLLSLIRIKDILRRHFIPSNIYKSCNISGQDMQLKTFYMHENEKTFSFENTSKKKSGKIGSLSHPSYCFH